jgi:hypothetical protein
VPRLEALEDRALLSTFTVVNLADSGPGSLRQAVLDANATPGADLIRFAGGLQGTLALTSGELDITDDLTVLGPGADRLTVSGSNASRAFRISSSTDVNLNDLTIADGRASDVVFDSPQGPVTAGGGILNLGGQLTLAHVALNNNWADGQAPGFLALGGGVANLFGGSLAVTFSSFTGNRAVGDYHGAGGAISNDAGSTLTVESSTFAANQAAAVVTGPTSGRLQGIGWGGAIVTNGGSQATVADSHFTENLARGANARNGNLFRGGLGEGGALYVTPATALASFAASSLTVEYSSFTGNQAVGGQGGDGGLGSLGGAGGSAHGGAITDLNSVLTVAHSTFTDNHATAGAGGPGSFGGTGGTAQGGAIEIGSNSLLGSPPPVLNASDVTFQGNQATGGNGGERLQSGLFGSPGGAGAGGALVNLDGLMTIRHGLLIDNQATGGAGGTGSAGGNGGTGGAGAGGGIGLNEADFIPLLDLSDVTLLGNRSTGGAGGTGGLGGNGGDGGISSGGGIGNFFGLTTVSQGLLIDNQVIGGAGGDAGAGGSHGGTGGNARGGGLFNGFGATSLVSDTVLLLNRAEGGAGALGGDGGNGQGGGLFSNPDFTSVEPRITLTRSMVVANQANGGAAGAGGSAGLGQGGGVYLTTPGATACADLATVILLNHASTSDDDIFGTLLECSL